MFMDVQVRMFIPGRSLYSKSSMMRHEERLGVGSDFVDNPVVLPEDESKLVVIHLELLFLKKNNLSTFRDLNTNTAKALGFTDESHDLTVKVHVQLVIVGMTNDESGKEASLGLLDLNNPSLAPFVLEVEEVVGDSVVALHLLHSSSRLSRAEKVRWELLHRRRSSVEEMT
jgi:hypothetical protein